MVTKDDLRNSMGNLAGLIPDGEICDLFTWLYEQVSGSAGYAEKSQAFRDSIEAKAKAAYRGEAE